MKTFNTKFKSGGLHEKHIVATWNVRNHLSNGNPNVLLSTLLTNTLGLRSSFSVTDQVPHPYKTTKQRFALTLTNVMT